MGAAVAVLVYGIVSSIVVAMAQGYTWDRNQQKVVMTSVLEVNSFPTGAQVSVDGQALKQLTPLSIAQTPGAYQVDVTKDGYYPWQFSTLLAPQLLTQIPQVPLFPQSNLFHSLALSDSVSKVVIFDNGLLLVTQSEKALHWWQEKDGQLKEIFTVPVSVDVKYTCQADGPVCLLVNDDRAYLLDLAMLRMQYVEGRPLLYDQHTFFQFHDSYYLLTKQANSVILQKIGTTITSQTFLADADAFTLSDNAVFFVQDGIVWEQSLITSISKKVTSLSNKKLKIKSIYADAHNLIWQTTEGAVTVWDREKAKSIGAWDNAQLTRHDDFVAITSGAKAWVVTKDGSEVTFLGQMADTVLDVQPYTTASWLVTLPAGDYVLTMKEPQIQNAFHAPYSEVHVMANQTVVTVNQSKLYYYSFPTKSWFGPNQ